MLRDGRWAEGDKWWEVGNAMLLVEGDWREVGGGRRLVGGGLPGNPSVDFQRPCPSSVLHQIS